MLTTKPHISKVHCSANGDNKIDSPVEFIKWGGRWTTRRQFLRGITVATVVGLGGNFLGITSFLLSLDGGRFAELTKWDVLVPVNSYKRYWNPGLGFEFQYDGKWLADQRLLQRAAERIERENPLDLPALKNKPKSSYDMDPVIAFGPPGSQGEENISVIVSPVAPGFKLSSLGSSRAAAEELLQKQIAPEGSNKTAVLIDATERVSSNGTLYYMFEYTVKSMEWFRHNLAIVATKGGKLYTLNAQSSEERWLENKKHFHQTIESFHVN